MSIFRPQALLIAGPTASGKSALALRLADRLGGVIVNADSMQVYRDLRILTARPTPAEEAAAPHRLYGHVDGAEVYSVARYLADAGRLVAELVRQGALPVIVGGTGLYFKALTEGLSEIPAVPDAVREAVRAAAEGRPAPALHAELAALDPHGAARLRPNDRQRILRALEVLSATGKPLSAFTGTRAGAVLDPERCIKLFLTPDRALTHARIDARFDAMIAEGALEEVRALAARGLGADRPVMRAHGVPGLIGHLAGEVPYDAAIERGKRDTRAYAKRQETWFRHQMPGFVALPPPDAPAFIATALKSLPPN